MHTRLLIVDSNETSSLALAENLYGAAGGNIIVEFAATRSDVERAVRTVSPVAAVFIPVQQYDYFLLQPLLDAGPQPQLVLLQSPRERYGYQLNFYFPFCLQQPYEPAAVAQLLRSIAKAAPAVMCLEFLLLKIDWRYQKIPFAQIEKIERKKTLTIISLTGGKTHTCFHPVSRFSQLLPKEHFFQCTRGLIVRYDKLRVTSRSVTIDGVSLPIRGFLRKMMRVAAQHIA